jgi:hypothetical protein
MKAHRLFFLFVCFSATYGLAEAQNSFRHSTTYTGEKTIVRQLDNNIAIAYTQEKDDQGYFLYDNYGVDFRCADMLPNCRVYDFEIYNDTVFFCGKYEHNIYGVCGLFGFFDINEVFFNGGAFNCAYFTFSTNPYYAEYDLQPTIPWRMDVFNKGYTHIAAVGACVQKGASRTPIDGTAVYDVYFDGTGWHCEAYSQKPGQQYYTDIVTTEHYVVAVAKTDYYFYNNCYVRLFDKVSGFLSSTISNHCINVVDNTPEGKVIVDAMDNDTFAVSNFYYNSTEAGLTVKRFAASATYPNASLVSSIQIPMNTLPIIGSSWKLRDKRYNNSLRKLALLLDMDYPIHTTTRSTVLEIGPYSPFIPVNIVASWIGITRFDALDQWVYGFHAIGSDQSAPQSNLVFLRKAFGTNSNCCEISEPVPYYDNTQNVAIQTAIPSGIVVIPYPRAISHQPQNCKATIIIDCE